MRSVVRVGNFRDHFLSASDLISAASVELKIILVVVVVGSIEEAVSK